MYNPKLFILALITLTVFSLFYFFSYSSPNFHLITLYPSPACSSVIPRKNIIKQRGSYYVLTNFIKGEQEFGYEESVTYATPSDFRFIDNLEGLVQRWNGPFSVALYAPGDDFDSTVMVIKYLRKCRDPLIARLVTFHIFFEMEHAPKNINNSTLTDDYDSIICDEDYLQSILTKNASYKSTNKLLFPINVARNIAREESTTHYVLTADIELNPSPKNTLISKFLKMIRNNPERYNDNFKQVFVLPVFEILANETVPDNKNELLKMHSERRAFMFHLRLCKKCHEVPGFDDWISTPEQGEFNELVVGKRSFKYASWEPFYIGTKDTPFFDERISWEGESNKMTQNYIMCLLDYDYVILNDAFVVHNPGIKTVKTTFKYYGQVVGKTNKMIKQVIGPEYDKVYGKREGCKIH